MTKARALAASLLFGLAVAGLDWLVVPAVGRLPRALSEGLASLPFYAVWAALGLAYVVAFRIAPAVRFWPAPRAFRGWNLVVLLLAAPAVASLYSGRVAALARGSVHLPASWIALLAGGILGPLVEEWVFRDLLWSRLEHAAGVAVAILYGAAVFAIWHVPFEARPEPIPHFVFGVVMGVVRWRSEGIALPFVLHAAGNSLWHVTT
jgi:membrane protease YdiL (CAAX protease family)